MRVLVVSQYSYWDWEAQDMFEPSDKMVAGGETAMVNLAVQLAKHGHEVMLFHGSLRPQRYKGVDFFPKSFARRMVPAINADVMISWEDNEAIAWNHHCKLVVLAMQTNSMMQGPLDYGIDYYQAVSNWHIPTLFQSDPTLPDSAINKFVIFPNGVNLERYEQQVERIPGRVIYTSSPDRGLHHLLRIWPAVKEAVPHASLRIFYDMKKWMDIIDYQYSQHVILNTTQLAFTIRDGLAAVADKDAVHVGPVSQWTLAQEQLAAEVMCYPCDTIDKKTEGFGISVLEAMAAGTPVITSNCDAFGELWADAATMIPLPVEGKEQLWIDAMVRLLTDKKEWQKASTRGLKKVDGLTWDAIGDRYDAFLKEAVAKKELVTA